MRVIGIREEDGHDSKVDCDREVIAAITFMNESDLHLSKEQRCFCVRMSTVQSRSFALSEIYTLTIRKKGVKDA
jgi:hypothetical protein